MSIIDVLRIECIQVASGAEDKDNVLKAIAELAKKSPLMADIESEMIYKGLVEREQIASTAFEDGIAIPHCFIDGLDDFVVGILTEPQGVAFDSVDKARTNIFFFIIGPAGERERHIRYLSNISHTLRIPETRQEILAHKTAGAIYEDFLRHASITSKDNGTDPACLCNVFVQNEDTFQVILEIICSAEIRGVAIAEAENADAYLYKMPLFASLFHEKSRNSCRIITCAVSKSLANELIRQIDLEIGGLEKCSDVMVAIQSDIIVTGTLRL